MLNRVTSVLRASGAIGATDQLEFNMSIPTPSIANISVFASNGATFHVKVKGDGSFPAEYDNYCAAWQVVPQYVPQPLGREFVDGREVLVFRGIPHEPVQPGDVRENRGNITTHIATLFAEAARDARSPAAVPAHTEWLRRLRARSLNSRANGILDRWIGERALDAVPHIRQHGDFATQNLGLTDTGLTVFDWEDFGRVDLAGLDLCTLLFSDVFFDPAAVRAIYSGAPGPMQAYQSLIERSCAALGIAPALFRDLMPLYTVIFLDLKREYGSLVKQRVAAAVDALS